MKHTPGPWEVSQEIPNSVVIIALWSDKVTPGNTATFGDYRGAHICELEYNSGVPTKEQAEANACLIAAAPDLLEACKNALESVKYAQNNTGADFMFNTSEILKQAIAKAEGNLP
jgi:hypothetical protein